MRHTSLTFTWVKLRKRPEVNSEPTHFLNSDKAFLSLDDMACSYQFLTNFSFYHGTDMPKGIGFLETFRIPIYYKIILLTSGIILSLKLKTKGTDSEV